MKIGDYELGEQLTALPKPKATNITFRLLQMGLTLKQDALSVKLPNGSHVFPLLGKGTETCYYKALMYYRTKGRPSDNFLFLVAGTNFSPLHVLLLDRNGNVRYDSSIPETGYTYKYYLIKPRVIETILDDLDEYSKP